MLIKKHQKGFTLFELMVTLLLAGIMMTGAAFIYIHFMNTWEQDNSLLEMQRQGSYALTVMEGRIKQANQFTIGNYGSGQYNKITVTIPTSTGSAKAVEYYQDDVMIKEKEDQEIILVPDTHVEGIEVEDLTFTDEGTVGSSVRIDLTLTDDYGNSLDFTGSVRLRNENVQ
ncbi:MAG: prepilin-type N-terminal cleavage/methylation domain-containing protein [Pseudomonadota bacterium]